jgi:hypothetical protein
MRWPGCCRPRWWASWWVSPGRTGRRSVLWAEQGTSSQDPDLAAPDGYAQTGMADMALYAIDFATRRRSEPPRDDLASLILAGNFGDGPMSEIEFGSFFVQLVTAGNDTTKTMLSSGLQALLSHPGPAGRAAGRSQPAALGGGGDPAMGQPSALLPAHGHGRYRAARHAYPGRGQGGDVVHVGQPRRGRLRRPPTLRHPPPPQPAPELRHRPTFLPRGALWPGWRVGCSSTSFSPRSPLSSRPARRSVSAPTSTMVSSRFR